MPGKALQTDPRLIQIVPRFPPAIDGLGDFALHLGDALWNATGKPSNYIVWRREEPGAPYQLGPHSIHPLAQTKPSELASQINSLLPTDSPATLLLHFTSYSYSTEGLAVWLPGLLRRVKPQGCRLVTFFHELYARGRFPNKTWMGSWLQKRIFQQLLELSDAAATSNAAYFEEMKVYAPLKPVVLTGIGSNVGEPENSVAWEKRKRRLVVFGLPATRARFYQQHLVAMQELRGKLALDEIADVGGADGFESTIGHAGGALGPVFRRYGILPQEKVSALLADSLAGVVNYRFDLRFKSGIVAAYQAHALPTILFTPRGLEGEFETAADVLRAEQILEAGVVQSMQLLATCAQRGFEHYKEHRSFKTTAEKLAPLLF